MKKGNQSASDERIRILNERTIEFQAEAAQLKKETKIIEKETKIIEKETEQLKKETEQLKKENEIRKKEADEQWKEIKKQWEESGKRFEETRKLVKEVTEQINKTDKQIGGLGNKFGGYTEAMAKPSIKRILERRFEADYQGSIRLRNTKDALDLEVDAWGVSLNGTGAAYIVEVKSKFRDKHIEQVWKVVERFRIHYSDYWERAVYPILAVVDISDEGRSKVWDAGIHLIEINDGVFRYAKPPKDFEANGYHGTHGVQRDVPNLRLVAGRDRKRRGTG